MSRAVGHLFMFLAVWAAVLPSPCAGLGAAGALADSKEAVW